MAPEVRIEQLVQRQLWSGLAGFVNRDLTTVARRAGVSVVRLQIAEALEQRKQLGPIVSAQFVVESFLIHRFRQHLRDVALNVVVDMSPNLRLAAEGFVTLKQIGHRFHDVDFELHVEILAVVQYATVMIRQPPWSKIDIETFVEVADLPKCLTLLVLFDQHRAAATGVITSTRSFRQLDYLARVTRAHQLVSGS